MALLRLLIIKKKKHTVICCLYYCFSSLLFLLPTFSPSACVCRCAKTHYRSLFRASFNFSPPIKLTREVIFRIRPFFLARKTLGNFEFNSIEDFSTLLLLLFFFFFAQLPVPIKISTSRSHIAKKNPPYFASHSYKCVSKQLLQGECLGLILERWRRKLATLL